MKEPIRVLLVVPSLSLANGVSAFVMNYFRRVNHEEVVFDFAVLHDRESPYNAEIQEKGSRIFILPSLKTPMRHIEACREIIANGNYAIVHNNSLILTIPLMLIAKRQGVPVRILHSHNSKMGDTRIKSIRNNLLLPLLRSTATDYFACSKLAGEAMFGKEAYTVLPNVINTKRVTFDKNKRLQIRKKMGVSDKIVVATVGRAAHQKNPLFALRVIKCLLEILPNTQYWWIGNGPLEEKMKSYAKELGIDDHIAFLGKRTDMVDLYQAMDVFFLPSIFEGLPLTGVEAQAMGLPCVVSDNVTNEMAYTDLVDFVSLNESPQVWADYLDAACHRKQNRSEYTKILQNSDYSDETCGRKMLATYKHCLLKADKVLTIAKS